MLLSTLMLRSMKHWSKNESKRALSAASLLIGDPVKANHIHVFIKKIMLENYFTCLLKAATNYKTSRSAYY